MQNPLPRIGAKLMGPELDRVVRRAVDVALSHPTIQDFTTWRNTGSGGGVEPLDQDFTAYLKSTGLFTWNTACIEAVASACASVPVCLYRRTKAGQPERIDSHPLLDLMRDPNPDQGWWAFMFAAMQQRGFTGEVFVGGVGPREKQPFAQAQEWWVIPSHTLAPIFDKTKLRKGRAGYPIRGWSFLGEGGITLEFGPDEIVHAKMPHPRDMIRGLSPMKKLETTLNLLWCALQANKTYQKQDCKPGMLFTAEMAPTIPLQKAFEEKVEEQHSGVKNYGRNMYVWGSGIKVTRFTDSPSDAQFQELMLLCREEILAEHKCPPFVVGLLEHANYSNSVEQMQFFYRNAVMPANRWLLDTWNTSPMVQAWGEGLYLEHDYSGIEALQEKKLDQAQRHKIYSDVAKMTPNEIRTEVGLDPIEGGDEPLPRVSPSPFGQGQGREEEPGTPPPTKAAARPATKSRGRRWLDHDARLQPIERAWARKWRTLFDAMGEQVLASFRRGKAEDDPKVGIDAEFAQFVDKSKLVEQWRTEIVPLAERTMEAGHADLGVAVGDMALPFPVNDPRVSRHISQKVGEKIVTIIDSRLDEVRALVRRAAEEGVTVFELQTRLREHFERNDTFWATRIARTETNALYNAGAQLGMEDMGVEQKEWLSARDSFVRPSHQAADGQVVGINEDFVLEGGRGPGPGMIDAPEESINCRCAVLPVVG